MEDRNLKAEELPELPFEEAVRPWGPWWSLLWAFVIISTWGVAQMGIVFLLKQFSGEKSSEQSMADFAETITGDGDLMGAVAFGSAIVGCLMILWVVRTSGAGLRRGLALKAPKAWVWPIVLFGTPFLLMALGLAVSPFQGEKSISDQGAIALTIRETDWIILLLLGVAVGAPFFEEFLFRGLLHEGLRQTFLGRWGAGMITAAGFSLLHTQYQDPAAFLLLFLLGCAFTVGRELSGSIYVPIMMHAIQNSLATIPMWMAVNGHLPADQLPTEMKEILEYRAETDEELKPIVKPQIPAPEEP